MAGAILAARLQRIPVVLDGYVATAAAAVLHAIDASALDHCVAGHLSAEGAHREVLERLGKVPLLALGIPSIPATAILLSALTIHGVQPGPLLLTQHPEVFWGLVASMYIGNVILLVLNRKALREQKAFLLH